MGFSNTMLWVSVIFLLWPKGSHPIPVSEGGPWKQSRPTRVGSYVSWRNKEKRWRPKPTYYINRNQVGRWAILIPEPTSGRGNYLVSAALDQRCFPQSERGSREIMILVDRSLPREIRSDLSLPYSVIPTPHLQTNMSLELPKERMRRRKPEMPHLRHSFHLRGKVKGREEAFPSLNTWS